MTAPLTLTPADVRRLFDYEDGCLYWREDASRRIKAGSRAGSKRKAAWVITFEGRKYPRPRLVMALHNGHFPAAHVFHINGNPFDDRITNLVDMTPMQAQALKSRTLGPVLNQANYSMPYATSAE